MTNDINTLITIYEGIQNNPARFEGINPQHVIAIKKAEEKMSWSIRNIQNNDVFFSGILDRMIPNDVKNMINPNQPTMYTDGKGLFYNPEFVNRIPLDAVETVIVHEILHVAFGHHLAFADISANHKNLWELVNIACDLAINHLLKDRSGFFKDLLLAGRGEFKDLPQGLDAREYFNILIKKYKKPPAQPQPQSQQQDSQNKPEDGEGGGQGDSSSEQEDQATGGDTGTGEDVDSGDTGDDIGDGKGTTQGETEGETDGRGSEASTGSGGSAGEAGSGVEKTSRSGTTSGVDTQSELDKNIQVPQDVVDRSEVLGRIGTPQGITEENKDNEIIKHEQNMQEEASESEQIEDHRREEGIQSAGYGKGSSQFVKGDYREMFKQKSNLPWNVILANFLTSSERSDRSYSVVNTRFADFTKRTGILMPGYKEDKLKELLFLVDVSGSMPRAATQKVFGEISTVSNSKSFGSGSIIRLYSFDNGLLSETIFTPEKKGRYRSIINPDKLVDESNIYSLPLNESVYNSFKWSSGGGGTHIAPALENIKKYLKPLPALVIVLTDGYFFDSDRKYLNSVDLPYKTVWLMTTDQEYPVGTTYHLSDYNYVLS